ncbi:hypothetical protein NEAUS04_1790 [Nematocida ausubeli]|nr:hypothetical protein NEAUS04_1790 [Nematocida ausubeli]
MNLHAKHILLNNLPEEIEGEVELAEFKNRNASGTVLLCNNKTYRLVCREDSNTFLMKTDQETAKLEMFLECRDVKYGEKEILEILPEISIGSIDTVELYIPKRRMFSLYPLTDAEYKEILLKNRSIIISHNGEEYFAKVSSQSASETFLLVRSLGISKESQKEEEIKEAFNEILPPILFQLITPYIHNGLVDEVAIKREIIALFKEISSSHEEFTRNLLLNGLQEV